MAGAIDAVVPLRLPCACAISQIPRQQPHLFPMFSIGRPCLFSFLGCKEKSNTAERNTAESKGHVPRRRQHRDFITMTDGLSIKQGLPACCRDTWGLRADSGDRLPRPH